MHSIVKTVIVSFPFDLFGSSGSGAGASLLADEWREVLADNRRESVPTRAAVYADHVRLREVVFETTDDYTSWRKQGRQVARAVLRQGDFLFWLTGNHLGALPVYDELAGQGDTLVVQLDAHLDIHHFRDCAATPSHGNFLLHVEGTLPPLVNIGHRELLLTPDYIGRIYRRTFPTWELTARSDWKDLKTQVSRAERVFLDIDCDVFDPAYFPAVSQPVPFGLTPAQVLQAIQAIAPTKLAGVMVSEFDPARDHNDRSLATLMWLLEFLLLRRYESQAG